MSSANNTPVYRRLVKTIRAGFNVLDEPVQNEIKTFISNQQNDNGGFMDRAGHPDLYYSLFGLWMSMATEQLDLQTSLKGFVTNMTTTESTSPVEDLALLLIRKELDEGFKKRSVLSIVNTVLKNGRRIESSYKFFLISLAVDACGKDKRFYFFIARILLALYKPKGNIPCSLTAALVYARRMLGLHTKNMQKNLLNFLVDGGGFGAFESGETADTLSTGVALFVLRETAYDIRVIKPGCLEFIKNNYLDGAFLSGDGDLTRDLEYTFYGLLALGSLVND